MDLSKVSLVLIDTGESEQVDSLVEEHGEEETEETRTITCGLCSQTITYPSERLTVAGGNQHTFTNPHGYVFEIGCFRDAPGCINAGNLTEEFTWFSGYAWTYTVCSGCHAHVGWVYDNGKGDSFYGLILNRLVFPD
jgi:hypothetical protein